MERLVKRRIIWFVETNALPYRQHRSTENQLAYLTQDIEKTFQEKKKVLAIFFDFSHSFDTVWKEGLQLKILQTGIAHKCTPG